MSGVSRPVSLVGQRLRLVLVGLVVFAVIAMLAPKVDETRTGPVLPGTGAVLISEVGSSNASVIADEDGDFPDWIELLNPGDHALDLGGYHLSDRDEEPARWTLPSVALEPSERLVVFASGKDRADSDQELHTDFSIEQSGEPLLLVGPDGQLVDRLEPRAIPRDASFGRDPAAVERTCYFAFPRPGMENAPECFDDADLGTPTFSADSGFYGHGFDLAITGSGSGSRSDILYTLDGSFPDLEDNAASTHVYDEPLRIEDRSDLPNTISTVPTTIPAEQVSWGVPRPPEIAEPVQKGTIVRARSTYGAERVATFFVGEHLVREELPVLSLAIDEPQLLGHEDGIYVAGRTFEEFLESDGFDPSLGWRTPANYNQRGREWERPHPSELRQAVVLDHCSAPGGTCDYQTSLGVRIHGNLSRHLPQKSLRLYARNDYGDRSFDHPFFGSDGPEGHRRLLLRNSGNDARGLLLLDGYLQSLMEGLQADTQAYQPAVLFINGEYWGIHNIRERYDRHYLAVTHGADPDHVVMLGRGLELETGASDGAGSFRALQSFLKDADPRDAETIVQVEREMDLDNFFDFVIAHVFVGNWDWPGNNVRLWREFDGPEAPGEGVRDGRWRWLVFDLDHMGERRGRYNVEYNVFEDRFSPSDDVDQQDGYPMMFHRLMQNADVRDRFLSRFADQLNSSFEEVRTVEHLGDLEALLEGEIVHHHARWDLSVEAWRSEIEQLRAFMERRPEIQRDHLEELFDLDGRATLRLRHDPGSGGVRVNTLELLPSTPGVRDPGDWHGVYFEDVPVTLEATPADGYGFVRWEGLTGTASFEAETEVLLDGDRTIEPVFEQG